MVGPFRRELVSLGVVTETEATLAWARAGDEGAFRELTEHHRRELQLHCYRILGSIQDAEDLVQETLVAAWRGLETFEGRASVRYWLYRIATNRCLNALRARTRRPKEVQTMSNALERARPLSRRAGGLPRTLCESGLGQTRRPAGAGLLSYRERLEAVRPGRARASCAGRPRRW
jgi:RNA polymerase sigma factor (sigma-70 family)